MDELDKKPGPLISSSSLSPGQLTLYTLIREKLASNTPITTDEAVKIYSEKVCRNVIDGVPHFCDYWGYQDEEKRWHSINRPLPEMWLRMRAIQWLMQAIGALVIKGWLKIIPMIELGPESQ